MYRYQHRYTSELNMNLHTERHLQVYKHNMCDMDSAEVFLIVDDLILKKGTVILINDTEIS